MIYAACFASQTCSADVLSGEVKTNEKYSWSSTVSAEASACTAVPIPPSALVAAAALLLSWAVVATLKLFGIQHVAK